MNLGEVLAQLFKVLLLALLKMLLMGNLEKNAPALAEQVVKLASWLYIPVPQRARWQNEWLGDLDDKQRFSKTQVLVVSALGILFVQAPRVGWIIRTKDQGFRHFILWVKTQQQAWQLGRLKSRLAKVSQYADDRITFNLIVKREIISFLAVPAIWFTCVYSLVPLINMNNAASITLGVLNILYLTIAGPLLLFQRLNRLLDAGILVNQVLAFSTFEAKVGKQIKQLEQRLAVSSDSDNVRQVRLFRREESIMQNGQLLILGLKSEAPRIRSGVSLSELKLLNLGPSHLMVQGVNFKLAQDLEIKSYLHLLLEPGEQAILLNQNIYKVWVDEHNQALTFPDSPLSQEIDRTGILTVYAAGALGAIEARRETRIKSDTSTFYIWYAEDLLKRG